MKRVICRLKAAVLILICAVSVTSCNMQGVTSASDAGKGQRAEGTMMVDITMEGGTGKAFVRSPVKVMSKDGKYTATLVWSSKNYDYVIVDGQKYQNENDGGDSTFTVPVSTLDEPFVFIADTVAMSKAHEIEYKIIWHTGDDGNDGVEEEADEVPGFESEADGPEFGGGTSDTDFSDIPEIAGIEQTGEVELDHAEGFRIKKYGNYSLISIRGVGDYLIVPEGEDIPETDNGIKVLQKPFDATYLVSTSAMDLVRELESLDSIRFSPLRAQDWDIPEVEDLMSRGNMTYAGKYRMPDYELLVAKGCDLAVENTMIYHDPEVIEKLEELGIPVIVETSSYEATPLGRLEWIKLYGVLFDREKEAGEYFDSVSERMDDLGKIPDTGKKVACFYVSATGMINVRGSGDYMAKMIGLAGGEYVPATGDGGTSSVNMQMEDFYAAAADADVLLYNGTIGGDIGSVDDLVAKNSLFSDFEAVKSGNVYCLQADLFRHPTDTVEFMEELGVVLAGNPGENAKYIHKVVQ